MRLGNIIIHRNGLKSIGLLLLVFLLCSPAFATCGPARLEIAHIERISSDGDITLSDQRKLRLAGLHLLKPDAVSRLKPGERISIGVLDGTPDRWSRLSALVFTGEADKQEWLQERLIKDGAALARPDEILGGCWPLLLAAERNPSAKTGVTKVEGGRFARVEGRVQRISDGRTAKFIGMTGKNGERIAGMILKRHIKRFSDNGVDVEKLRGQIIRIRGVRNLRNATIIALTSVDQIEIIR